MEIEKVRHALENAVREIYRLDYHLLSEGLNERAITPYLMCYLCSIFPNYNVDHEYNGNVENPYNRRKQLIGSESEFKRFETIRKPKRINGTWVINITPDVIIHKRGSNNSNLLVVEVKKTKQFVKLNLHDEFDITKLNYFTGSVSGFDYKVGAFVQLGINKFCISYFVEGLEIPDWKVIELRRL